MQLANLAEMHLAIGDLEQCLRYLNQGIQISQALGEQRTWGRLIGLLGEHERRTGRFSDAAKHFAEADAMLADVQEGGQRIRVAAWRAMLARDEGDSQGFDSHLQRGVQLREEFGVDASAYECKELNELLSIRASVRPGT